MEKKICSIDIKTGEQKTAMNYGGLILKFSGLENYDPSGYSFFVRDVRGGVA